MSRILTLAAILGAFSAAPFRAGVQPEGKTPPAGTDRRKLIGDIQADYDRVLDNLNRADPGAETRAKQKRILEALDKLIDEPDPPSAKASSSPPPKQPDPAPPPPKQTAAPKQTPAQPPTASTPAPKQAPAATSPPTVTVEKIRQEQKIPAGWAPDMPPRHRQALDAFARDRIPPAYEELLRAYYRTLAESGRDR